MKKNFYLALRIVCTVTLVAILFSGEVSYNEYMITGPFSHKNLTVFLIKGEDKISGEIISLEEALNSKKIIIYETGDVNELCVENRSDTPVFIQSGDIIKGGKQDRVIQYDLIIKPNSGKIPLASFCVEHGRWSKRANENEQSFSGSTKQLSSKRLKMAVKTENSQQDVWEEVGVAQDKLSRNVGGEVKSSQSESSLQLTLENEKLNELIKEYIDVLSMKTGEKQGVIGYAFAINGVINSADIYANNALFQKLWPKLIESCVTEALGEWDEHLKFENVTLENMKLWLAEVETGVSKEQEIGTGNRLKTIESDDNILFETYDSQSRDQWIHKNMIKK
jgi:hypothetical protein